jgi:methylglutaconyl-CoA hydratase
MMDHSFQTISITGKEGITTVELNRPELHNAMNDTMIAELTAAFMEISKDNSVRAVILRGKGKSFCAGADLNYMKSIAGFGFEENEKDGKKLAGLFHTIYECPVTTIAVVHGAAFGGANGLLAACDIVLAEENTRFAFSEVKLGIAPATIAPFVIKRIGEFGAKELMMTGKRFNGKEAEKWHLVNHALPQEELNQKLNDLVKELKTAAPQAVRRTKELIRKVTETRDLQSITDYTAKLIAELRASEEGQEGMAAFLEKRKPGWTE